MIDQYTADELLLRLQDIKISPTTILIIGNHAKLLIKPLCKAYPKASIMLLDSDKTRLAQAKKHTPWFRSIKYIYSQLDKLPLEENSIDLIISNLNLPEQNTVKDTYNHLQRILKPEGLLMLTTFGPDTLNELRTTWAQINDQPQVPIFLDMHDIGDAVFAAGFKDPVMDVEKFTLYFQQQNKLIHSFIQVIPALSNQQNEINEKILSNYPKEANKGHPVSYEITFGHAWGTNKKPQKSNTNGEFSIPVSQIKKRKTE